MTNCDKIRNAVHPFAGQGLTTGKVVSLVLSLYPGTNPTSIIPSDHSGPNPRSGRSYCKCSGTQRQIFARGDGVYVVRGQNDAVELRRAEVKSDQVTVGRTIDRHTPLRELDVGTLVETLRRLKSSIRPSLDRAWRRDAALRVLDCVLSLNRNYDSFVVPRLDGFERKHPQVRTLADLQTLMKRYQSPSVFVRQCLDYRDDARSTTLARVVDWLASIAAHGDYETQMSNLERWAVNAKPEEHFRLGIAGFGLGGFQYLRMLFGANTTKPDIHIQRYVASLIGRRLSDVQTLLVLETAAAEAGVSLRDLDTTIWEGSARSR